MTAVSPRARHRNHGRAAGANPRRRALARRWGIHLGALTLYLALAILLTWPVVRDLAGTVIGFPGDNLGAIHSLWWVWDQVSSGHYPWASGSYGYPSTTIFFHPSPLMELISLPFTGLFGAVVAANLLVIGSFVATGYTCFLLVRHLCGSIVIALSAGALFTATGPHQFDLLFNTNAIWALPLTCLAFLRWRENPRRWPEVAVAASALALCNFYFGAYFLPPLFALFILTLPWARLRHPRVIASAVAASASTLLVCVLAYLPPILAIDDQTREQLTAVAGTDESRPPTELLSLVIGSPNHPYLGGLFSRLGSGLNPTQAPNTGSAYLGLVVIALAIIGWSRARHTGPWTGLAAVAGVMMLGPSLLVAGHRLLPLPYTMVDRVPLLNYLRAPSRFYALFALALIVMAAFGLQRIVRALNARDTPRMLPAAVVILIAGLAVFDSLFRLPQPVAATTVPTIYERLATLPQRPALIEVPGGGFNDYQWLSYQRIGRMPLVNDASPRGSTAAPIPLYQNPFLSHTVAGPSPDLLESDEEYARTHKRPNPHRVRGVRELADLGVGYALLHGRTIFAWGGPDDPGYRRYRQFLERYLGAPVYEDAEVSLYALPDAPGLEQVRRWGEPPSPAETPAAGGATR